MSLELCQTRTRDTDIRDTYTDTDTNTDTGYGHEYEREHGHGIRTLLSIRKSGWEVFQSEEAKLLHFSIVQYKQCRHLKLEGFLAEENVQN